MSIRCLSASLALGAGLLLCACDRSMPNPGRPAYRNLFAEYLEQSEDAIDAKIEADFQQLFYGDDAEQRLYYPVGDDMAYIWDVAENDVRTEGMSYGMMIAVQLDKKEEFDRLWKWSHTYMRHADGPLEGYFAWHCRTDGTQISPGSASDGEIWFATALLFASNRWGNGDGIYHYENAANEILREMLHKEGDRELKSVSIFDRKNHIVRFVPWSEWDGVTDPSYHVPAFYELWAKWAHSDNEYWAKCAEVSREFFRRAAHPTTGLMADYTFYDGRPRPGNQHEHFRFDAWRTLANVALDHDWWGKDSEWQTQQSNRVLSFLMSHYPDLPNQFKVDGTPLSDQSSSGLTAMAAVAGLAAKRELAEPFVRDLWQASPPTGNYRYYDGMLHLLALLQVGGRFHIIEPDPS